jgi:Bacterial Ig-like domain (group 2)
MHDPPRRHGGFVHFTIEVALDGRPLFCLLSVMRVLSLPKSVGLFALLIGCTSDPGVTVTLTPASVIFTNIGETRQVTATAQDGGVMLQDSIHWSTSDTLVATVTSAGLVTATGEGQASISAQVAGIASSIPVTVDDACQDVTPLMFDQPVLDSIAPAACLFEEGLSNLYELQLSDTTSVLLDMVSGNLDAALEVRDSMGTTVASDDQGGAGDDARINRSLSPGTYMIIATSAEGIQVGAYTLTLTDPCQPSTTIQAADTVSGQLTNADCVLATGTPADRYVLTLTGTLNMQIDLKSGAFDPYLELYDSGGALIASDHDSGNGFDAQITMSLGAGSYAILAVSANTALGAYELEVVGS